jgi:hypothetical protein
MTRHGHFIVLTHEDRIRVQFALEAGVVVDFVVQYEAEIQDQWRVILRYDLAHGFLHRDRPDPLGELTRKEPVPYGTLAGAMTEAIREIKTNWSEYRRWYEGRLK